MTRPESSPVGDSDVDLEALLRRFQSLTNTSQASLRMRVPLVKTWLPLIVFAMQLEKEVDAVNREAEGSLGPRAYDEGNSADEKDDDDEDEDIYDIGDADVSRRSPFHVARGVL